MKHVILLSPIYLSNAIIFPVTAQAMIFLYYNNYYHRETRVIHIYGITSPRCGCR